MDLEDNLDHMGSFCIGREGDLLASLVSSILVVWQSYPLDSLFHKDSLDSEPLDASDSDHKLYHKDPEDILDRMDSSGKRC